MLVEPLIIPEDARAKRRFARLLCAAGFAQAFMIALFLDAPLAQFAHESHFPIWLKAHETFTKQVLRAPGRFYFTVEACAVIGLLAWRESRRAGRRTRKLLEDAALVFISGVFSGVNVFGKWLVGRTRPYHKVEPWDLHFFAGGLKGLFVAEANLSFPSGDVTLAFAMTASLGMVAPRWWPLWWMMGLMVAMERIAENAHYPSDTVAGAALGIACALAARRVMLSRAIGEMCRDISTWGNTKRERR